MNKKLELQKRYPINTRQSTSDDPASIQSHIDALENEMKKSKPRDQILLPLMKSTFDIRREFVRDVAVSVRSILDKYPALTHPSVVCTKI